MAEFFVKTDSSSVGPFSGIELREAAMAGILCPESLISGSAAGPWMKAQDIGLYSEKKMPLPHPPGTPIPQFEIDGLLFAADGPFKLRELIGFAARGMIRPDAKIQTSNNPGWHPIQAIPMLNAVLSGALILLGSDGKVVRRAQDVAPVAVNPKPTFGPTNSPASGDLDGAVNGVAPAAVAGNQAAKSTSAVSGPANGRSPKTEASKATPRVGYGSAEDIAEYEAEQELLRQKQLEEKERAEKSKSKGLTFQMPNLSGLKSISPSILIKPLAAIAVVAILGFGAYAIGNMGTRQEHVIGEWISDDNLFAIAFKEDGTCVCFNTTGKSWTGQYEWTDRGSGGFESSEAPPATIDSVEAGDETGPVKSGDGYLRLQSPDPSFIGTHQVNDCFVRRTGEKLKIGYPTSASYSGGGSIDAGWKTVSPTPPIGLDVLSDLSIMEFEPPSDDAVENGIPHVTEVIPNMLSMYETGEFDEAFAATACYSQQVNAAYLLATYGPPDEARSLFPQELKFLPPDGDYSEAQMARYGVMKMILSGKGELMFLIMIDG